MPVYRYRCEKCESYIDLRQSIHEDPYTLHEICGGYVTRVFAAVHFNKRQGQPNITEDKKAKITEHWDGRQDVMVKAPHIKGVMNTQEIRDG